ncbi:MAG: carotenoid biosynthesis protein [Candidatus Thorarchaeota archaeon]|nr:carotenoid biosynthesis protein [Candidatus Thorarchaeota archaeon]
MSRTIGFLAVTLFVVLSAFTAHTLWYLRGVFIVPQTVMILAIGLAGEHYVSGKGYYHYTPTNGLFIGRVPVYIPFMWVFVCQSCHLAGLWLGLGDAAALVFAGTLGFLVDFVAIEPVFSRQIGLWLWKPVDNGFFSFVPPQFNRFTAPVGNYLVWMGFPFVMGFVLDCMYKVIPLIL